MTQVMGLVAVDRRVLPVPYARTMLHISRRARVLLDVVFAAGIVLAVLTGLNMIESPWRIVLLILAAAVAVGCWVAWRRQRTDRSRSVVALTVAAIVTALLGDGAAVMVLIFVVLAVLVVDHGFRAGLLTALGFTALAAALMALVYHQPPLNTIVQSIGTLITLSLGVAIGQLLREIDQARRENARLLAELRTSFQSEKDLVLAEERARAARDLHDGLGHQLTAIRMGLDFAERARTRDDEAAWAEVARCRDLSVVALDRMRVWVRALDPIPVAALTDAAAFEEVAESFRGTGLDVKVRTTGDDRLLDRETALFGLRVAQEGLTNALRHAGARRVDLTVDHSDTFAITVTDDGERATAGGSGEAEPVDPGYGLRALSDRAKALGGTVTAGWTAEGFRLRAEVPVTAGSPR